MSERPPALPTASEIAGFAEAEAGIGAVVLFGSRARGDAAEGADWDVGYLADRDFEPEALRGYLVDRIGSERVDLVDLSRASGLLRFRAARDGVLLYEATPGAFEEFRVQATLFWCDMEPVFRRAYDDVLESLSR